jgi:cysteinyl-tRNA synthetase
MTGTPHIRVYTTLGRSLVPFEPRDPGKVAMYVCGPTVQSEPHMGHGRAAVAFDVIRRYLRWRGFDVTYVQNITDVEDKIIAAAAETGESTEVLAARMADRFRAAYRGLGVEDPDIEPKATEHIPEMLELIQRLIDRGLAYPAANGDVYFSVRTLSSYGRLSGRRVDELRSGARIEIDEDKRDPLDFALWKSAKPGEPHWDSPWGSGRPGWHIECSAMAHKYLGDGFDIHGGGSDLIFPHHENEIAQSEGASGETFSRYWLHNGMVNLGGEKMAKSTGHLIGLHEAIDRFGGIAVRLFYLRAHYRSPLEYSETLLEDARSSLERIQRVLERSSGDALPDESVLERFRECMDDDFATPEALAVVFDAVKEANRRVDSGEDADGLIAAVAELVDVLGIRPVTVVEVGRLPFHDQLVALADQVGAGAGDDSARLLDAIVDARGAARAARDFATADAIRDRLSELGIVIEDTADGARWIRR